jgi:hypothetical protein
MKETTELTVDDILETPPQDQPEAKYHTILEAWTAILSPADKVMREKPSVQWARRMMSRHDGLEFKDLAPLAERILDRIKELRNLLLDAIDADRECLDVLSAEEDLERNGPKYRSLVFDWQFAILHWELEWDSDAPTAAIDLASMLEVQALVFGDTGIANLLEGVSFQLTEDDQTELASAMETIIKEQKG